MVELGEHLPREQWSAHPRWPEQVLLLGSHANFRSISRHLVAQARAADGSLAGIASLYLRWIAGMRSHEAYEEHKLYPYLTRRWGVSLAAAEAGHEQLHACHAAVVDAITDAAELRRTTPALAEALRAHDETLVAHLELEEDLVIPRLLALEPDEFRRYTHGTIEALLAELA